MIASARFRDLSSSVAFSSLSLRDVGKGVKSAIIEPHTISFLLCMAMYRAIARHVQCFKSLRHDIDSYRFSVLHLSVLVVHCA